MIFLSDSRKITRPLFLVLLLFVGSGVSALIYETVWLQMLQLVIGSSSISLSVLLATFMGGMGAGSILLPRLISRRHHPLRVYAALECAIGVMGITLLGVIPLVGRVYTAWGGYGITGFALRGVVAAMCLVPPTCAMGGTLPIIARWTGSSSRGIPWLGFLYAGNIAGAVFGTLFAGFYLLRVYDMTVATLVAAAINITLAVVAAFAPSALRRAPSVHVPASPGLPALPAPIAPAFAPSAFRRGGLRQNVSSIHVALALSGFSALAAETIWTRTLSLLFGGTVYTFSIILAVFLIGLGVGSAAGSFLARRIIEASTTGSTRRSADAAKVALGWCQVLAVGGCAWTAYMLADSLPFWPIRPSLSTSIVYNFQLDFVRALWALWPAPLLWGASFPFALVACKSPDSESTSEDAPDPGRAVGGLYAANTAGAILGAIGASVLIAWIGSRHAQQIMMLASALAGLLLLASSADGVRRKTLELSACALVVFGLCVSVPDVPKLLVAYGRHTPSWAARPDEIIYVGEGMNTSIAISRTSTGVLNYHNAGKIQASGEPQDMRLQRMLGHLTTLLTETPRSVLVIGCGAGVTAGAVSVDPAVERVTIAEIEPLVPRVVSEHFGTVNHDVVKNPKTRVYVDDARHYLMTTKETFDGITSDPLDPWVKGAATLYTKEFFELMKTRLNAGGVVTIFVQLYDSSPAAVKSEVATFFEAFPDGIIWGNTVDGVGYDMVLFGQQTPSPLDVDALEWRLTQPNYVDVSRSLGEVGIHSAAELLATYAGRASDVRPWLGDAVITHDRDLRLEYLAGLGLNQQKGASMYGELLTFRRFPDDFFTGLVESVAALKTLMFSTRE